MRTVDPDKHAARRQAIIAAAKSCFARKGFHKTSTAAICTEADISSGSLFHYFPNKKAIVAAIVEQEREQTTRYFTDIAQADDLFSALLDFMDAVLSLAADSTYARLALEIAAEATRDPDVAALSAENDIALRKGIADLLSKASERRQIDPELDAAATAHCIAALIDGIFNRVAVDPQFAPLRQRQTIHLLLGRFLQPQPMPPSSTTR